MACVLTTVIRKNLRRVLGITTPHGQQRYIQGNILSSGLYWPADNVVYEQANNQNTISLWWFGCKRFSLSKIHPVHPGWTAAWVCWVLRYWFPLYALMGFGTPPLQSLYPCTRLQPPDRVYPAILPAISQVERDGAITIDVAGFQAELFWFVRQPQNRLMLRWIRLLKSDVKPARMIIPHPTK